MNDKSNASDKTCAAFDEPPLFLADAMLGRLSRWLRLMGYDTLYASALSDHQIAARARAERRIVLTRDRELARRRGIRCLLVQSQFLKEQIKQVFATLGLSLCRGEPRCSQCNAQLEPVTRDEARARVPAHVLSTHTRFCRCANCNKIYWQGSHWQKVRQMVEPLLNGRAR